MADTAQTALCACHTRAIRWPRLLQLPRCLRAHVADEAQTALFAGRRSSDVTFLLLQNLFCARHLKSYAGTSAVSAVAVTDWQLRRLGVGSLEDRRAVIGAWLRSRRAQLASRACIHDAGCYPVRWSS